MNRRRGTVYSTDHGRHCRTCGAPKDRCQCNASTAPSTGDGIVRLQRQTKGRAGKPVVIITGLPCTAPELKTIAKVLKQKCGVGGTVEDGQIVIQGNKRDKLKEELERQGYSVKLSGG